MARNGNSNPLKAGVRDVAEFLNFLFEEKKLALRTVQGYRAAICRVIKLCTGKDYSNNGRIGALVKNFAQERPVNRVVFPQWDLRLVLEALRGAPYEPLERSSLLHLSRKTAFLLLLAAGARRGELHAVDVDLILTSGDKNSMVLKPNPRFLAKNFNPATGLGHFSGFTIRNLAQFVGQEEDELLLCPMRALLCYLKRTKKIRRDVKQLFISCKSVKNPKGIHKNTLSVWMKRTIREAYGAATDSNFHRATHEIRAVAASLALYKNVSSELIIQQCRWRHQSTFTSFYLRDWATDENGMNQVLPVMAAGAVVVGP